MAKRKKYPKEFKLGATNLVLGQGYTCFEIAQSFGISPSWKADAGTGGNWKA